MKLRTLANPIAVTRGLVGLAGTAVGLAETVAVGAARTVLSGVHRGASPEEQDTRTLTDAPLADTSGDIAVTDGEDVSAGPFVVPPEPHAPAEPPIDVVGQALDAEAALGDRDSPAGASLAHEPRGASRDEEHGNAPLQRAETDAIADEVAAALGDDIEPDEHLTEPLLDPAEAKALAAEMQTMRRAADPDKG